MNRNRNTILVCDDEPDIVAALKIYLEAEGFSVLTASNGKEAVAMVDREPIQLVLLDIMMPVMDGITAMSKLRETHNVPIILLTAKGEEIDMILGLNVGADDYITKPFRPVELLARVKAQIRRYMMFGGGSGHQETNQKLLRIGGIEMDDSSKRVTVEGEEVNLTPTEYAMLKLFMENPGKVFTKQQIFEQGWEEEYMISDNNVMVCISKLRSKLDTEDREYIRTIRGLGYRLEKE